MVSRGSPSVTVVVPTRNRAVLLQEAVGSVQKQTIGDWELIVVDDASSDSTPRWLNGLRDPRIRTMRLEQHLERSAARNRGMASARSDFILFLDDDDRLLSTGLERLLAALNGKPEAVAAIGARVIFNGSSERYRFPHARFRSTRSVLPELMLGWVPPPGQCLFRAEFVRACGGFNDNLTVCEDYELWLKMSRFGPAVLVPQAVLEYRVHDGQMRHPDSDSVFERIRNNAVGALAGEQRDAARGILEAKDLLRRGAALYTDGRFAQSLKAYLKACLKAPVVVRSPITGPGIGAQIARSFVGLAVGSRIMRFLQRLKASVGRARVQVRGLERDSAIRQRDPER